MGTYNGIREISEMPENKSVEKVFFSQEALDKYDCILGDDRIGKIDGNGYKSLSANEKKELAVHTDWSEKAISGCKINEDGIIKYPCRREDLAGQINEITGVKYEKQIVDLYGYKVEVVMPEFNAVFEVRLPEELIKATDRDQFKECNKQLYDKIKEEPELAEKFSDEQVEQIEEGITKGGAPDDYTWHHDAETGTMQLIDSDLHGESRHTGGKTLWGGGNDNR